MKQSRSIMGMPISVEILDLDVNDQAFEKVFAYFTSIDNRFSTYKKDSEITSINEGKIIPRNYSQDMKTVFKLSEQTRKETGGYFDIQTNGKIDPSGLVKGWAIFNAAKLLGKLGFKNFYVDAGGDIQVSGRGKNGKVWKVGIKNPFNQEEIVKVVFADDIGVATSGTYIRGQHIYNPHEKNKAITDIVSLTIIGKNVYEADRFATAAFAMGKKGIEFVEKLPGFEGYMIDSTGIATMTSGFEKYTKEL
jgi:thiamine biosynthesis lipoprotein